MTSQNKLARREDIPETAKWHLNDIFATHDDWQTARDAIEGQLTEIKQFAGKLSDPQQLLDCLTKVDTMEINLCAVFAYARMMADTDTANQSYQADTASCLPLLDQASAACAFIEPELLSLPEETLRTMADKLPGLKKYQFRFQDLLRGKEHVLTTEQEAFLARTGEIRATARNTYTVMTNADM
ncbi:MAG: oligoendopeptidase F, partial [Selenomonas sp.]|nr:oligoendopeptidase F [Selenomonas sp.]